MTPRQFARFVTLADVGLLITLAVMCGLGSLGRPAHASASAGADGIEVSFEFPERRHARTVVRGLIAVPQGLARTYSAGGQKAYSFDLGVTMTSVARPENIDRFELRFDPPAGTRGSGPVPLVFERTLEPGDYSLEIELKDLPGGKTWSIRSDLSIPELGFDAADFDEEWLVTAGFDSLENAPLRIRPLPRRLLTGNLRIEADARAPEITSVAYVLNGRERLRKSRPPFSVDIDLGKTPRLHRLEVVGYDSAGAEIARDERVVNAGPHRLAVRLLRPLPGQPRNATVRFLAEVEVPEREAFDSLQVYVNEEPLATLERPPFQGEVPVDPSLESPYVRAVARMSDGRTAEDLVFLANPHHADRLEVHFVELYTTVLDRKGRPVDDLEAAHFSVLEDAVPQTVRRFERLRDRPVDIGILLDVSGSMAPRIDEAEDAAKEFLTTVLKPADRAAVVLFNEEPYLRVPLCNDAGTLAAGLTDVKTGGGTALYDGLIQTLYEFAGLSNRSVIVLLSDGSDQDSEHNFEDALEFARRVGAAIYTIGVELDPQDRRASAELRRLAEETGGRSFQIRRASDMRRTYEQIVEELHSEYVLGYQSGGGDPERFRRVQVDVIAQDRPGLEARTVPGYYP